MASPNTLKLRHMPWEPPRPMVPRKSVARAPGTHWTKAHTALFRMLKAVSA